MYSYEFMKTHPTDVGIDGILSRVNIKTAGAISVDR